MNPFPALATVLAASVLVLSACGSETGADVAADPDGASSSSLASSAPASTAPASSAPASDAPLAGAPAAPVPLGRVTTHELATVISDAKRPAPELCLGPVAESYPPMCSGLPLVGWDWDTTGGAFESQGRTRWGSFAVTGTFDGTTMTVTSAVPAALYDAAAQPEPTPPTPAASSSHSDFESLASDLMTQLPGALNASADPTHVLADVVYDDGSIQQWADATYGAGVVVVHSALVDVAAAG